MLSNALRSARSILLVSLLLFSCHVQFVHADEYKKESLHAAFTFNFSRFTEWPEEVLSDNQKELVICIAGDQLNERTSSKLSEKKIDKRNIAIHNLLEVDSIDDCHVLFINSSEKEFVEKILKETTSKPILTVGISQNFLRSGGIIRLFNKNEKIRFSVNTTTLSNSGLKISSRILKLAVMTK